MSEETEYITIRIPKFYDDLIEKYLSNHRRELMLLGQRASRAGVIKKALYEFLKREGVIR